MTATTDAARGHASATVYEASRLDIAVDPAIRAAWPGARLCGPAYTVQGAGGDNLALHHAVLHAPAESVIVADLGGARHGHWGEVLAVAAQARGIAGLLIDGGVRDSAELADLDFPVFSRNNSIVGTRKHYAGNLGVPVDVGGMTVTTGDLVLGDADGVVVLPADRAQAILDAADARVAQEADFIDRLRAGASTLELYSLPGGGL